jgi:ubiquinone/menaquinone biosynthesis C-methylase UbiE
MIRYMQDVSNIDWNEVWKAREREKRAQDAGASCAARWSDPARCRKFSQSVKDDNWRDARERIASMKIAPDFRILDIGAGPGTLAIPLAGMIRQVTAVEPSAGMLECLHENIREQNIHNITTIRKKWEDIDPRTDLDPPYDVVVASYSLGVPDLRAALEKMDAVSKKYVYIFWFADLLSPRHRQYLEIWEDLFGKQPAPNRTPNIIFNLLSQMGIFANVEISRTDRVLRFSSLKEAVADQRDLLRLMDDAQVTVLKKFLMKTLRDENGQYLLRKQAYQAKIWWEKET